MRADRETSQTTQPAMGSQRRLSYGWYATQSISILIFLSTKLMVRAGWGFQGDALAGNSNPHAARVCFQAGGAFYANSNIGGAASRDPANVCPVTCLTKITNRRVSLAKPAVQFAPNSAALTDRDGKPPFPLDCYLSWTSPAAFVPCV